MLADKGVACIQDYLSGNLDAVNDLVAESGSAVKAAAFVTQYMGIGGEGCLPMLDTLLNRLGCIILNKRDADERIQAVEAVHLWLKGQGPINFADPNVSSVLTKYRRMLEIVTKVPS